MLAVMSNISGADMDVAPMVGLTVGQNLFLRPAEQLPKYGGRVDNYEAARKAPQY